MDSAPSLRALEVSQRPELSGSELPEDAELTDEFGADRTPAGILVDRATLVGSRSGARRALPLLSAVVVAALGATLWWKAPPKAEAEPSAASEPAVAPEPVSAEPAPAAEPAPEPVPAEAALAAEPAPEPVPAEAALAAEAAPAGTQVAYDAQRLDFALRWARTHAERCHQGGRAVGTAQLSITFASNGRVSAFELTGEPIASAPVARCVATYFQSMLIPAFDGPAFTIHETLTLR